MEVSFYLNIDDARDYFIEIKRIGSWSTVTSLFISNNTDFNSLSKITYFKSNNKRIKDLAIVFIR